MLTQRQRPAGASRIPRAPDVQRRDADQSAMTKRGALEGRKGVAFTGSTGGSCRTNPPCQSHGRQWASCQPSQRGCNKGGLRLGAGARHRRPWRRRLRRVPVRRARGSGWATFQRRAGVSRSRRDPAGLDVKPTGCQVRAHRRRAAGAYSARGTARFGQLSWRRRL